jgi:outer membrane protein OmpA-like peptidoglycan-associated protein
MVEIRGQVINKILETPVLATLTLQSLPDGADLRVFQSDEITGNFSFNVVDNKPYKVKVSAKGYMDIEEEITVDSNSSLWIIGMMPKGSGTLLNLNINFDQGTSKVMEESFSGLDKLVGMMTEYPEMEIQLEGHTDFRGSARANQRLSERRVLSIKNYLITENVSPKRIKTKAFGGSRPLSKDNTEEAKLMNRRVQARILKTE